MVVRLAAVSGFYDFARRMDLVESNPAAEVKRPKLRPPTPSGLDGEALRRLLKAIPNTQAGAWLAQVQQRTGSDRTPRDYARELNRFLVEITPTIVHFHVQI